MINNIEFKSVYITDFILHIYIISNKSNKNDNIIIKKIKAGIIEIKKIIIKAGKFGLYINDLLLKKIFIK